MSKYKKHIPLKKAQNGFDWSESTVSGGGVYQDPYTMSSEESYMGGYSSLGASGQAGHPLTGESQQIKSMQMGGGGGGGFDMGAAAGAIGGFATMFDEEQKPGDPPELTGGETIGAFSEGFATGFQIGGPWGGLILGAGMVAKEVIMQDKALDKFHEDRVENMQKISNQVQAQASAVREKDRMLKFQSVLRTAYGGKDNPYISLAVTGNELVVNEGNSLDMALENKNANSIRNILKRGYRTEGEFSHNTNEQYVYKDGSVVDDKGKLYNYRIQKGANIYNPKQIENIQKSWGSDEELLASVKDAHREQVKHGNRESIT